jgi:DNA-binding NarL/FixJ family response regulator
MKLKILLVDDQELFRSGLVMLLEDEEDMELCGEAGTGRQSIELAQSTSADVVVMDINLPDMSGMDATQTIKQNSPATKVLILTAHETEDYLQLAKESGAEGFLLKRSAVDDLADAIRCVSRGEDYVDGAL